MTNKTLIYFTSFFCGMSVMAVELSASRLLAPYFGSSSIIWTIIIGLIMISLSLGNILGGRSYYMEDMREKSPDSKKTPQTIKWSLQLLLKHSNA